MLVLYRQPITITIFLTRALVAVAAICVLWVRKVRTELAEGLSEQHELAAMLSSLQLNGAVLLQYRQLEVEQELLPCDDYSGCNHLISLCHAF